MNRNQVWEKRLLLAPPSEKCIEEPAAWHWAPGQQDPIDKIIQDQRMLVNLIVCADEVFLDDLQHPDCRNKTFEGVSERECDHRYINQLNTNETSQYQQTILVGPACESFECT